MPVYIAEVETNSSGVGSADFGPVWGVLGRTDYAFHADADAGTDATLITVGGLTNGTVLTLTNVNTTGVYVPQQNVNNQSGTQQTSNFMPNTFHGEKLRLSVAGAGTVLSPALTIMLRTIE